MRNHERAFMELYDATCRAVYAVELVRLGAEGVDGPAAVGRAEDRTRRRYLTAWGSPGGQQASGLSPLTWLLSLDVSYGQEASCA